MSSNKKRNRSVDKDKTIEILCQDWADDHTHLVNLCLKAGVPEDKVHGDSYGVPGIMDLADMLYEALSPPVPTFKITLPPGDVLNESATGSICS